MLHQFIGCILLFFRLCVAADYGTPLPLNRLAAFASTRKSLHQRQRRSYYNQGTFQLQTQPTKQVDVDVHWPPTQNKTPKSVPELPPHTALAQVLANQHGFDLASVVPSRGPGTKITAEDVEYHAWKIKMPPCTEDALEVAYSIDLDLNEIYDDDDREYVMQLSDVELYQENVGSLKMTSQKRRDSEDDNMTRSSREKLKKVKALDQRMGKGVGKLSKTALKLTGGIFQMVQVKATETLRENGLLLDLNDKSASDIKAVGDFDEMLAHEIEEALSCVDSSESDRNDDEDSGALVAEDVLKKSDESITSGIEEAIASKNINGSGNEGDEGIDAEASSIDDLQSLTEDFEINLAGEIKEAISTTDANGSSDSDNEAVEPTSTPSSNEKFQSMTVAQLKGRLRRLGMKVSGTKAELIERLSSNSKEEFQSMTVVQLKQQLRELGMKVSGKKADLIDRLMLGANNNNEEKVNGNNNGDKCGSPLFFAAAQGSKDE